MPSSLLIRSGCLVFIAIAVQQLGKADRTRLSRQGLAPFALQQLLSQSLPTAADP